MTATKKQLAHLFDATQCIGCNACMVACAQTNFPELMNRTAHGKKGLPCNISVVRAERGGRKPQQLLVQCQQCKDAPCVRTCPFGANYYDENGMVRTDTSKCVGCSYCVASCPYDARWIHPDTGAPMKCMGEGCHERLEQGLQPACVEACPAGARLFGDVNDPESGISKKIRSSRTVKLLEHMGTEPNFFVVVQK